jgi:hypothetical protein
MDKLVDEPPFIPDGTAGVNVFKMFRSKVGKRSAIRIFHSHSVTLYQPFDLFLIVGLSGHDVAAGNGQ